MSLVDRVNARARGGAKTAERASEAVTLEEFGYLLGQSTGLGHVGGPAYKTRAGTTVGVSRALGITSWYSGVRYLTESLAGLPVGVYRDTPTGTQLRASPKWLLIPDVEMPLFGLVKSFVMALLHRGNAYAWKIRDPIGRVIGLRYLHPDRVRVGQATDGTKIFQIDNGETGWTRREVLHIPGLSYDGVLGLDPIRYHAENLGTVAAADEYAGRHFGQGTHVQAYLSVPQVLSETQANDLKANWEAFHRGLANAHEFGVLGGGATYNTITLDPQQQQLLESRQFGVLEVARMLRVQPHKLYDLNRATYNSMEQLSIDAATDSVRPWVECIEAYVNFDADLLPRGNYLSFNLDGLMRGDAKSRAEYYHYAISDGWMSRDEPRMRENLPYKPGLDTFLVPQNMSLQMPDGSIRPINEPTKPSGGDLP
ncbi:phage portal protein [Catellatospora sp. NPDC049609]|uniref:phage portal protein n=1 Tax=Catellatospora sp. NPDC049609 TaxID=3155505 RepID=UPI00342290D4